VRIRGSPGPTAYIWARTWLSRPPRWHQASVRIASMERPTNANRKAISSEVVLTLLSIDEQLLTSFRMSRKESDLEPISGDSRIVWLFAAWPGIASPSDWASLCGEGTSDLFLGREQYACAVLPPRRSRCAPPHYDCGRRSACAHSGLIVDVGRVG
jgi:hypothetical protein